MQSWMLCRSVLYLWFKMFCTVFLSFLIFLSLYHALFCFLFDLFLLFYRQSSETLHFLPCAAPCHAHWHAHWHAHCHAHCLLSFHPLGPNYNTHTHTHTHTHTSPNQRHKNKDLFHTASSACLFWPPTQHSDAKTIKHFIAIFTI